MSLDSAPRYRRRTRWPIIAIVVVLAAVGIVVWVQALKPAAAAEAGCNTPGPAPTAAATASMTGTTTTAAPVTTLGTFTAASSLAGTRPADPSTVSLRVLNASTVTGQAKTVTDELRAAGFAEMGQQANDPLYPAADLRCYGEIRYGYAGLAAARTTLIVAPCAQLVLDGRTDASVDLSLGNLFEVEPISKSVQQQLAAIKDAAAPPPVIEGQTLSIRSLPPIPALPDRSNCPA